MLKFVFWSLLAVNGVLFAYGQGYLGKFKEGEREPARLKAQLNADKLALISPAQAESAASQAKEDAAAAERAAKEPPTACLEIGDFEATAAKKFETQLASLALGDKQTRINVPVMEVNQHVVFIPPQGSKEAADRKANELRNLGITNYYVISDNSSLRWGISLGVFKSEAAAQTLLAALNKQGVHSARVTGRGPTTNKFAYQFRNIDAGVKAQLTRFEAGYQDTDIRSCK
ncbi:MAG TPA: SPOR domain-containing protein [Telluria sp.]|nr:SPOR domain-containing protein [Telluria sp.]